MAKLVTKPPHSPTPADRKKVRVLSGLGIKQDDIAAAFGIDDKTLRKHYREELDGGKIESNSAVARSLYNMATDPDKPQVSAAIFWLKCQAGWKDQEAQATPAEAYAEALREFGAKLQA